MNRIRPLIMGFGLIVATAMAGCAGGGGPGQSQDTVNNTDVGNQQCRACLKDDDCAKGRCVQFPNNNWCEANCVDGGCADTGNPLADVVVNRDTGNQPKC
mgnify:CR=1 FL=1